MIARALGALGALALAASVGFVTPWVAPLASAARSTQADRGVQADREAQADLDVQQAVQRAFGEVQPDTPMHFALGSAQSSPVEGGGQRLDGSGIGTFGEGDARFVAFTMTLSARGELVEFDYSTASPAGQGDQMAAY